MKWVVHAAQTGEKRKAYHVLVVKNEEATWKN
jgi:hypothetical protein